MAHLRTFSLGSFAIVLLSAGCGSPLADAENALEPARVATESAILVAEQSREIANEKAMASETANARAKQAERALEFAEEQLRTAEADLQERMLYSVKRNERATEAEAAAIQHSAARAAADAAESEATYYESERDRLKAVYDQLVARANSETANTSFQLPKTAWGVIGASALVIGCVAEAYTLWRRRRFHVSPFKDIFVSYRRTDSSDVTGRIFDKMKTNVGEERLFKDVDSIPIGKDFRKVISTAVGQCKVLLVVIGNEWLGVTDDTGRRRIDDPDDYVHIEIATALARGIPVVPVLVENTPMPRTDELPDSLNELAFRNGTPVRSDPDFHHDMDRLCNQLAEYVE